MKKRARVQLIGEVTGVGRSKVQAYFELRDDCCSTGARTWTPTASATSSRST